MAITTINIGAAPNDHTGDTIRDSFDICNLNFQDLDTTKFDIPTGTDADYLDGEGTPTIFPTIPTQTSQLINDGVDGIHPFLDTLDTAAAASQMRTYGRNSTGATLYKGYIVYISGATGNRPNFTKAQANSEATSAGTFGVVIADIPNNDDGYVCTIGALEDLDNRPTATNPFTTDTLSAGDTLYLSPTIAGYVTNVKPYAPNHLVYIGKVVRVHPTLGTNVYRIQNGYELDEIHDVAAQTPSDNDGLFFESATSLWKNKTIANVLGYTPQNADLFSRISKGWEASTDYVSAAFNDGWTQRAAGVGASITTPNSIFGTNKNGICIATTGTTLTGFAGPEFGSPNTGFGIAIGNGEMTFENLVMIPTLSNATERFIVFSGLTQPANFASPSNGIFFYYDEGGVLAPSQINWKCYTSNLSTRTLTTSSIQVIAGQWYKLKVIINSLATSASFYIDGTLVATHTTNINSSVAYALNSTIQKTTGLTARTLQLDYSAIAQTLTTPR